MELATRRVIWFGVTAAPNPQWVTQQARNVAWTVHELGIEAKFLIRDNDAKFGGGFDLVMEGEGIEEIRTPILAPWRTRISNARTEAPGVSVWTGS